ncbi:MAG TPA: hypothetical protein VM866_11555 [Pyrinomonadaceae bacterium]|jgi:hypothetical protein|nr:hypothetical protein [Pyrinomonadaceae bacterium]
MSDQRPDDNNDLLNYIAVTVETMRDQMATKSDLARLEAKMDANFAAVRGDIEQVQLRVDSIERALRARLENMETEISRLRSVLYLLVKDKPDMLRLLGQTPQAPPP